MTYIPDHSDLAEALESHYDFARPLRPDEIVPERERYELFLGAFLIVGYLMSQIH